MTPNNGSFGINSIDFGHSLLLDAENVVSLQCKNKETS